MNKQIVLTLFCLTLFVAVDAQTVHLSRLQRAAGIGYVPYTDGTGKAAYTLLSSLITPSDFGSGTNNRIAYWLNDTLSSTIWEMNSTYIRGSGTGWPQMENGFFTFRGDTDTGVKRTTTNTVGIMAGDATNPRIRATSGVVDFDTDASGTAEWGIQPGTIYSITSGAPRLSTTNTTSTHYGYVDDTNTGMSRKGADTLGIYAGDEINPITYFAGVGNKIAFDPNTDGTIDVEISATTLSTELLDIGQYGTTATKLAGLNSSGVVTEMTVSTGLSLAADVLTATDASITNELQDLTIGGSGPTYTVDIASGSDVTIAAAGINTLSEGTANVLTITGTEVDGSITNEIQSISVTGTTTATLDLSDDATDASITGAGIAAVSVAGNAITITATEIDGSVSNELQDLTIGGSGPTYTVDISSGSDVTIAAAGIATLSEGTPNILTITATEVDGSTTNEIQQITPSDNGTNFWWALGSSTDSIVLVEGTGITMSRSGDNVTINAAGGGVTGSGTTGEVAVWSSSSALTSNGWSMTSTTLQGGTTGDPSISLSGDAYTFNGDTDTGIKRTSANVMELFASDGTNSTVIIDGGSDRVALDPDDDGTADVTISATTLSTELLDIGTYGTTATKIAGLNASGVVTELVVGDGLSISGDSLITGRAFAQLSYNGEFDITNTSLDTLEPDFSWTELEVGLVASDNATSSITTNYNGYAEVTFNATLLNESGGTFSGLVYFQLFKNGTYLTPFAPYVQRLENNESKSIHLTGLVSCASGDDFHIEVYLSTAGTIEIGFPVFNIKKI